MVVRQVAAFKRMEEGMSKDSFVESLRSREVLLIQRAVRWFETFKLGVFVPDIERYGVI
jgi:hypothetical protein